MRIGPGDRDRIHRICRHELGHFLVARETGFNTGGLSFSFAPMIGHRGGSSIDPSKTGIATITNIVELLESRILVLYAGVIAESIDDVGNYDQAYAFNEWRNGGAIQDYALINELALVLRSVLHPGTMDKPAIIEELNDVNTRLAQKAFDMVLENNALIIKIALAISQKITFFNQTYTFTNNEIDRIIADHLKGK